MSITSTLTLTYTLTIQLRDSCQFSEYSLMRGIEDLLVKKQHKLLDEDDTTTEIEWVVVTKEDDGLHR